MSPRIILITIGGVLIYLTLSLYHGYNLKQLPDRAPENTKTSSLSARDQERNWVQVTSSEENRDSSTALTQTPDKPQTSDDKPGAGEPILSRQSDAADDAFRQLLYTSGEEQAKMQQSLAREQKKNQGLTLEKENLLFKIKALQTTLQDVRAQLQTKEGELQNNNARQIEKLEKIKSANRENDSLKKSAAVKSDALNKANARIASLAKRLQGSSSQILDAEKTIRELNSSLVREQKARQQALATAGRLQDEREVLKQEEEQRLAETGRLHGQLKEMKSRLLLIKSEIDRARLKADAMLRYGQEQTKLITPFRQEIEILNGRLGDANTKLLEGEQAIAELEETRQQLRQQLTDLQAERAQNQERLVRLAETEQILATSRSKEEELTVMLKALADQLNEKEALIATLNQSVAASQAAALQTDQQTTVLRGESAGLQEALHEMENRTQVVQKQLDETLLERDNLKAQLQKAVKQSSELAGQNSRQKKQLDSAERTAADLEKSLQKKSAALLKLETLQKKNDSTIKQLKKKLRTEEKRIEQVESQRNQLQTTSSVHKSVVQGKEKKIAELRTKLTRLQQELDAGKQQLKETAALVSGRKEQNRQLEEQLQLARGQNQQTRSQAKELTETKNQLVRLQDEAAALKSELDLRERSYFTLQEELSALQMQHEKILQERKQLLLQTTDGDNDGVADSDDTCPQTAAGVEVDSRGCESDSDGDGLVNRLDLCVESPAGADIDQLGCQPEQPVILHNVRFASGTAKLTQEASRSLDKLVIILHQYPTLTFEIGGHTDSIGEEKRNLTVSRKRAEAVADYLIDHGIQSDRINARGYGPEHPVADNDSPAGRTANRRVELKIIPPLSD